MDTISFTGVQIIRLDRSDQPMQVTITPLVIAVIGPGTWWFAPEHAQVELDEIAV